MDCHLAEVLVDILTGKGIPAAVDDRQRAENCLRFAASVNVEHHPSPEQIVKARQVVLGCLVHDLAEYSRAKNKERLFILRKGAGRNFRDAMLPEDPLYIDIVPQQGYEPMGLARQGLPSRVSAWCYCLVEQESSGRL